MIVDLIAGTMALVGLVMAVGAAAVLAGSAFCWAAGAVLPAQRSPGRALRNAQAGARRAARVAALIGAVAAAGVGAGVLLTG